MIPAAGLGFRVSHRDGVPVAVLEGEIDIANAADVRGQLFGLLADRPVAVDLSDVKYIDSRGVHVRLELAERMKIRHQTLRLVVPEEAMIRRILQLTHLDAVVAMDTTREEAVARARSL